MKKKITILITLLILVLFLVHLYYQRMQIEDLKIAQKELKLEYEALQTKKENLIKEINIEMHPDLLEIRARQYEMIKPGEVIYSVIEPGK